MPLSPSSSNLLRRAAVLAAAGLLSACVTHRVNPVQSRAVLDARAHKDVQTSAGCPDLASPLSVAFGFGEGSVSELNTPALEQAAQELACHPAAKALVVGSADNHGTDAEQRQLAQTRIKAVSDYLRAHGIAADRLQIQVQGKAPGGDAQRLVILAEGRRW
jgi:outer membrane protein OmpA-like peptidoglycan-associated protein